ncbi:MAG TPA: hypothetical protein VEB63_01475 [Chitinophagaceae bacterium]|nr:hypothetical protein [Chitinophagaceae bacterium]
MRNRNRASEKDRRGDTGRTSSQGRKTASGGDLSKNKRGNPEMDENAKSVKAEMKLRSARPRKS